MPVLSALETHLLGLLRAQPRGLGEYELLKALQGAGLEGFPQVPLFQGLPLFRMHCRLFHALYRLREQLWAARLHHLEISPLSIELQPYRPGRPGLVAYDPLRAYYADWERLQAVTEEEVAELLDKFWGRFHAFEQRNAALAALNLAEPVDYPAIRRRYRHLVSRHHPDRGGDKARLQTLNAAMAVLERYYRG
jgi:DnaJ-domain-containing protein 1